MAARRRGAGRDADALARLEALVKAVEEEARANGTLYLFERWKASLPVNPAERSAARASPRRRRTDAPG
ncbi:MAG: hypothetical protein FJ086_03635 [Deltaproteobacteria bacterium]|nr:hypothetical protein [Deltaproteobacteria bacterium]